MRPLLVSLLLLALCRPSSAAFASFEELVVKRLKDSFNNDANFMSVMAAANSLLSKKEPDFKDATLQGVACMDYDSRLETVLKYAMYGTTRLTQAQQEQETAMSKEPGIDLDCAGPNKDSEPGKCFCRYNRVIAYCAAMKYYKENWPPGKGAAPPAHCSGVMAFLKEEGMMQLGEEYEIDKMRENHEFLLKTLPKLHDASIDVVDEITKNSKPEELKFLCDATNPAVATHLEKLFKTDLAYPKIDAEFAKKVQFYVAYSEMPDPTAKDYDDRMKAANDEFKADCAKPESSSDPFMKCICEPTKGLLYCVYNDIGQKLKKEYLKCDAATPTVDAAKKPSSAVAPAYLKPKPPKPTTTTAAAPSVTTTTAAADSAEAANGAAATSSLLLAPLAAAAAALLLL